MSHWGATLWGQVGLPQAKGPRELWGVCGGPGLIPRPPSGRTHRDPRAECHLPATRGAGVPGWGCQHPLGGKELKTLRSADRRDAQCDQGPHVGQVRALDGKGSRLLLLGRPFVSRSAFPGPCYLRPRRGGPSGCPPCPRGEGGLNRATSSGNKQKLPGAWLTPLV